MSQTKLNPSDINDGADTKGFKKRSKNSNSDLLKRQPSKTGSEPKIGSSSASLGRPVPDLLKSGGPDLETSISHEVPLSSKPGDVIEDDSEDIEDDPADYIRHWKRKYTRNYGYFNLFRFATPLDHMYMFVGIIAAIIGGLCVPMMVFLYGNMIRKMVLITQIQHSFDCEKYPSSRTLGNTTDCENFKKQCVETDKPFEGQKLNQQLLDKETLKSMHIFVIWHTITAAVFTVCSSIYFICWHTAADNQGSKIRKKYFEALLKKDMTFFEEKDPNSVHKLMNHTRAILQGMGEDVPNAISLIVNFILSLIMAFSYGYELSLLGLISFCLLIFTNWLVSYTDARKMIAELRAYKAGNEFAEEILQNIRTVIFYGGQKQELLRYKKKLTNGFKKVLKWIFAHSVCLCFLWLSNFVIWAVIFWYGIAKAILSEDCKESSTYSDYDAGDVIIIILSIIFGAGNIYLVFPVFKAMSVAKKYGRKVFNVIDTKSKIDGLDTEGTTLEAGLKGEIEFEDVKFTYPTRKDDVVLNHLNLHIKGSSKVAIVGLNGCGKSSIVKLICKEYLPDSGFVKIDGVDIRELSTKWLRSQIGVVPQNVNFFDDTIEANVRTGKTDASFFEIQEACKSANAHNFIVSFKEAYKTRIGTNGFNLTTGQQQRLAIARALLRNPKILLLDEPTSSLDPDSEIMIMDTLNSVSKDRTVVLISHRLHTVTSSDMIYLIKRGKVAEKGTHSELLKSKGAYTQLASGNFDKPSTSVREIPQVTSFDASEITAIHYRKLFCLKPFWPNIYNDLLSVDPVAVQMTDFMLGDVVISTTKEKSLFDFDDTEFYYALENKDSVIAADAKLSKSESNFKDKPATVVFAPEPMPVEKSKIEGLRDILNPCRYPIWKVLRLATASSYKLPLLISVIASIVIGLALPIFGILFAEVIAILSDASAVPGDWKVAKQFGHDNYYIWIIIGLFLLGLCTGVAAGIQDFALSVTSFSMIKYVRKKVFAAFLRQDLAFFENPTNGVAALRNLLFNNVTTLRYMLIGFYGTLVQCIIGVAFAIVLGAAVFAGNLTGYTVAIAAAVTVVNFTDGWLSKKQQLANIKALGEISALILQVFKGKHNVTIMQLEPFFLEKFTEIQLTTMRKRRRISYFRAFTFGLSQTAVFWGYSLFIYLAANEIVYFNVTFTSVIAIGEMLLFGLMFLGFNLSSLSSIKVSVKAGEEILNVLYRPNFISNARGDEVEECNGNIEFHDAHFWYPFAGDNPLLKGVSVNVSAGQTVAIVGSSESGKNDYLDLVMRFYDVTSGSVTLDDKDVRELNLLSLRRQIGYIDKVPQLFNRTVAENIAYGDNIHKVTMSEIIEAAKKTKMHNFICSLPDGYDTRIGGENDRLTGAQKQRIMIARALLRNPKLLLVDEPMTSLDREGEKLVNESIEAARQGRTCIIIAHRLRSIQNVDLIVMMVDGYIQDMGTHAALLKPEAGEYGKLWRSQSPLEDDGFASGKVWTGKSQFKFEEPKPYIPPPPPEVVVFAPPEPEPTPEEPKPVKKDGGGWCVIF